MLVTLAIKILQPLLSLLLWTFNYPPATWCSPTNWALSTHEPDCQSCNISGMFLQSNQIYLLDIKEKLKRQALADSENEKRLPCYLLIYGPIHWQSKILPYYLIPLCNIFPLMSCARHGYKKKSHINNQTTSKIWHSTTSHENNNLSGLLTW